MKRSEILFNALSVPIDACMLLLASIASFYIRLHASFWVGPVSYRLDLSDFLASVGCALPLALILFSILGLYNLRGVRKFTSELGRISIAVSLGLSLIIVSFFFDRAFFPSRFIVLAAWGTGIVFVSFGRIILRLIQQAYFKKGYGLHNLVVIKGDNTESKSISKLFKDKKYGYKVVEEMYYLPEVMEKLQALSAKHRLDEIIQTNPSLGEAANLKLLEFCRDRGMQFSFVPSLFEVHRNSVEVLDLNSVPVISLKNSPLDGWGKVAKKILDVILSSACLVVSSPVFLFIYLAIKLDTPGSAIYYAPRMGTGKSFRFYKFRTMYANLSVGEDFGGQQATRLRDRLWSQNGRGDARAPLLKVKDDPRVTRVGKFLRRTKLDEIPQFWNVLRGDMSMVGPRAHVLDEVERYRNRYSRMFSIKPGIFGLSQLAQIIQPTLSFEEEIRLNTFYIENWSLWLDFKILAQTFWQLLFGDKPNLNY